MKARAILNLIESVDPQATSYEISVMGKHLDPDFDTHHIHGGDLALSSLQQYAEEAGIRGFKAKVVPYDNVSLTFDASHISKPAVVAHAKKLATYLSGRIYAVKATSGYEDMVNTVALETYVGDDVLETEEFPIKKKFRK